MWGPRIKYAPWFRSAARPFLGGLLLFTVQAFAQQTDPILCEIGELEGKRAVLIDDMIDTAGSVTSAANMVAKRGASEVYAYATHAVLSGGAVAHLAAAPIEEVVVTDTVPLSPEKHNSRIRVLSIAPVLADAIRRVHGNISVSDLFDRYWHDDKR